MNQMQNLYINTLHKDKKIKMNLNNLILDKLPSC